MNDVIEYFTRNNCRLTYEPVYPGESPEAEGSDVKLSIYSLEAGIEIKLYVTYELIEGAYILSYLQAQARRAGILEYPK